MDPVLPWILCCHVHVTLLFFKYLFSSFYIFYNVFCSSLFYISGHKSAVSVLTFDESGGRLVSGSRVLFKLICFISRKHSLFYSNEVYIGRCSISQYCPKIVKCCNTANLLGKYLCMYTPLYSILNLVKLNYMILI